MTAEPQTADLGAGDPLDDPVVVAALRSIGRRRFNACPRCLDAPQAANSAKGFCQPCDTDHAERIRASKRRSYHRRKRIPTVAYTSAHQRTTTDGVLVGDEGWRLLNVEEAAKLLGVSRTTVYALLTAGRLRSLKLGRARRIPADAIADLVARAEQDAS